MSLQMQFSTLGMMMTSGLCLGLWFDVCRVLIRSLGIPRLLLPLLDFGYWLVATGFVFWVLLQGNQGRVRFFIFLGLAVGIWLYFIWLSRWMIRLMLMIVKVISTIVSVFLRIFRLLIITPMIWLYRLFRIFFGLLVVTAIFLYKIVVQLLCLFLKLGRNLSHWIRRKFK